MNQTLNNTQLRGRLHDWRAMSPQQAQAVNYGRIDVDLLAEAGLKPDPALVLNPVVLVEFASMRFNPMLGRDDPIYLVRDTSLGIVGHFSAAAFSALSPAALT